jgi:hypothetical protein
MRTGLYGTLLAVASISLAQPAAADVVSDWNETAIAYVHARNLTNPPAERAIAMMHVAMFDAVNSIDRRYRPYLVQAPAARNASREAAAAAAAGAVLSGLDPQSRAGVPATLAAYLARIPDGPNKAAGVSLGEAVGARILAARAGDGADAPDAYRVRTAAAGVYAPTPPTVAPQWPGVRPFAMTSGAQFRPPPPPALDSAQWATDYNEIREFGARDSARRSARQTEDARFWIATSGAVYYPLVRAVAASERFDVLDTARLYALVAVARADAFIAVFDAKYHYEFWRPVTAIRNGDIDGNPATERDADWQPIDATPMHPEYACAHCIVAASTASVLEAVLGTADIREVAITSPATPGVTHRWTNLHAFVTEVSEARIWAGFHYRFSTVAGVDMGRRIGAHVVANFMQPVGRRRR